MTEKPLSPVAYLDANIFIFFFQGDPTVSGRVKVLFDSLRDNPGSGVTSELTLAEVMAASDRPLVPALKREYLDLIVWGNFISLVPVSRDVLYASVDLRAAHKVASGKKLDLPDAIHLATAIQKNCQFFVSGDERITPPIGMRRASPLVGSLDEVLKVFQ